MIVSHLKLTHVLHSYFQIKKNTHIFRLLKLELLTQFPAPNDEKYEIDNTVW